MFLDQSKRVRKKSVRFKAAAVLTAVLTCIIVPLFYLVSRPGYSEQRPSGLTRTDLLVAMTATTQRYMLKPFCGLFHLGCTQVTCWVGMVKPCAPTLLQVFSTCTAAALHCMLLTLVWVREERHWSAWHALSFCPGQLGGQDLTSMSCQHWGHSFICLEVSFRVTYLSAL